MTITAPCLFQLLEAIHILWLLVSPGFTPSSKLPVAGSLMSHLTSSIAERCRIDAFELWC